MEHTQDLPTCASFAPASPRDQPAWRCDINHALGRYYMAGDKRTCPGCGTNKNGMGKVAVMDFYMPAGVVVRQDVDIVLWKPRKPYRAREGKAEASTGRDGSETGKVNERASGEKGGRKKEKAVLQTHNQIASRKYWDAVGSGMSHDAALVHALSATDAWVDEKEDEAARRASERSERIERIDGCKRSKRDNQSTRPQLTSSLALNALRLRQHTSTSFSTGTSAFGAADDDAYGTDADGEFEYDDADAGAYAYADFNQASRNLGLVEESSSSSDESSGSDSE
ncbi:hypothetical protein OPT61_g10720 [Boeremia exigua]|uniref:Uncharacterized protein n=1 Tax=Boeremia exigua TaxID=749465 RepID=A0ACC2HN50_9PLEO|nr:hypothetical protein OPT61_g10720 [Boeremia exigua]